MVDPAKAKPADGATVHYSRHQFTMTLEELVTEENLFRAYKNASRGKHERPSVFNFDLRLGQKLEEIYTSLLDGTYRPSPCYSFDIFCTAGQKIRTIAAPHFSDTIVQHLLYGESYSDFDRGFIFDSYGCRRLKGTHRASDRVQQFIRESPVGSYYLQIDIRKYYYNIDHSILRESIERRVADKRLVDLFMMFCDNKTGVGLNVGCLLSQLYGMVYLDRFDHWVKRNLKIKHYVRYVDDMVFVGLSKDEAYALLNNVKKYLKEVLHLELSKWKILPLGTGINFAGFWTYRNKRLIRKRSLYTLTKRIKQGKPDSVAAVLAHAKRTSSYTGMLRKVKRELPPDVQAKLHKALRQELSALPKQPEECCVRNQKAERSGNIKDLPKHLQVALSLYQR